jgi:hypothetical protein
MELIFFTNNLTRDHTMELKRVMGHYDDDPTQFASKRTIVGCLVSTFHS